MTTTRDAIGLSDRLRDVEAAERRVAGDCDCRPEDTANWQYADTCREAATALDALQAAYLQSQTDLQNALGDRDEAIKQLIRAEDRAIRAEQQRDEALERLKPFAAYSVGKISKDVDFDYSVHVCCSVEDQPQFKHFDAARDLVRRLAAGTEKEGK